MVASYNNVFLNLDLKLLYSLRLSLNDDPTCRQRLRIFDRMALYKFDYFFYPRYQGSRGVRKKN